MTEQVFGLTVNEVIAYAAVVNLFLVLVLVLVTMYYERHERRQADASREQVAASNRQAEVAQKTLDFLLKEREQQRQIDVSAVRGWRDGYRMGAVFERKKESSDKGSELWVTG